MVILVLPLGLYFGPQIRHNMRLRPWKAEFVAFSPPRGAVVVETDTAIGELTGGTACAQRVEILLDTEMPPAAVEQHYQEPFTQWLAVNSEHEIRAVEAGPGRVRVYRQQFIGQAWDMRCM
ncbi:MAG TPA: hypothetical protein VGW38_11420 [Chloroflexota bacterium]|nr:hypothetical protein [Chloroflexota bacterium]